MTGARASGIKGLWHVALNVRDVERCRAFYEELFGMTVVWQPDPDNVYLSSGRDNLALHRMAPASSADAHEARQKLDHLGFIVESRAVVDRLCAEAERLGARIIKPRKEHRDGSYSFYLADPDGTVVQVLYEPTVSHMGEP